MNEYYSKTIERLYIQSAVAKLDSVQRGVERLRQLGVTEIREINSRDDIPREHLRQETIFLSETRGEPLGHCPASKGQLCCNYHTLDLYMGCSLGCTYCAMKSYLNFSPITIQPDIAPMIRSIQRLAQENPQKAVRIGTGELGDSLLFDPLFELSRELMQAVAHMDNVVFEMKTKTDAVDQLLNVDGRNRSVVGFSLNAPEVSEAEDGFSVSLEKRFAAAEKVLREGMSVAFHFDPMINALTPKQQAHRELDYRRLCGKILQLRQLALSDETIDRPNHEFWPIAWVSMGTVRFTPSLRERIEDRPYLFDEYALGPDGKYRYLQPTRARMYRWIYDALQPAMEGESPVRLYMCMESDAMWRRIFGKRPANIAELEGIYSPLKR